MYVRRNLVKESERYELEIFSKLNRILKLMKNYYVEYHENKITYYEGVEKGSYQQDTRSPWANGEFQKGFC